MLRRRKHAVRGELPPVIVQDIKLDLSAEQRAQYNNLWANRSSCITSKSRENVVAMLGPHYSFKGNLQS